MAQPSLKSRVPLRRSGIGALTVALALALGTTPAAAQPKPKPKTVREELPAAAVRSWDDGRLLLLQQTPDYEKALVKFQEAYELSKNPRVLFNVAVSQKNLNQYANAVATLRRELVEGGASLTAAEKADIATTIAALERYISTVEVSVDEPGATVLIDDQPVGTTPLAGPLTVDIGERRVSVQKQGFATLTKRVNVRTGVATRETFALEPVEKKTRVTISVTGAPGATIRMDGTELGPAPFTGDVPSGRHSFSAEVPGYVPATQTSDLKFREPLAITLALAKKRQEGRLRMEAEPAGTTIEIDGRVMGATLWEGVLPSGAHQVTLKKSGYQTQSLEITMSDDADLRRKLTLQPSQSGKWVAWVLGGVAVVGGGVVASYFLLRPLDERPVPGSLRKSVGEPVPAFAPIQHRGAR